MAQVNPKPTKVSPKSDSITADPQKESNTKLKLKIKD